MVICEVNLLPFSNYNVLWNTITFIFISRPLTGWSEWPPNLKPILWLLKGWKNILKPNAKPNGSWNPTKNSKTGLQMPVLNSRMSTPDIGKYGPFHGFFLKPFFSKTHQIVQVENFQKVPFYFYFSKEFDRLFYTAVLPCRIFIQIICWNGKGTSINDVPRFLAIFDLPTLSYYIASDLGDSENY